VRNYVTATFTGTELRRVPWIPRHSREWKHVSPSRGNGSELSRVEKNGNVAVAEISRLIVLFYVSYLLPYLDSFWPASAVARVSWWIVFFQLWEIIYTVFQKSDAKIQVTITTAYLIIRIKYPLSGFNCHLSGVNVANLNKIRRTVSEQQLFTKWNSKTEVSNMENAD